jgi:hypothetical protein
MESGGPKLPPGAGQPKAQQPKPAPRPAPASPAVGAPTEVPGAALFSPDLPAYDGGGPEEWHRRVQAERIASELPPSRWQRMGMERRQIARSLNHRLGVMRKATGAPRSASIPEGGGSPLPSKVRQQMEARLGADLSGVNVHTGGDSAAAATELGARAFTVGNDVHFGAGEFAPGSREGDKLLAHELTHVVQGARSGVQRKAEGDGETGAHEHAADVSQPDEPAEKEADAVGEKVSGDLHDHKSGGEAGDGASHAAASGGKSRGGQGKGHGQDTKGKDANGAAKQSDQKDAGKEGHGAAKVGADAKANGDTRANGTGDNTAKGGGDAAAKGGGDAAAKGGGDARAGAHGDGAKATEPAAASGAAPNTTNAAPPIAAKLQPGFHARKIMRAAGPPPAGQPTGTAKGPGAAPPTPPPPPVVETGTMKGVPHTLTADPGAKTVTLDGGDAIAAGNAAKAALPEAGDPRLAEATQMLNTVNQKLGELRTRVGGSTPPTTAELKALSRATMAAMQAFGDKFDVKRLGEHLPEFPSPVVGPHPVAETKKPPDGSTRESHHAPPAQLALMLAGDLKKVGASLMAGTDSKELTPAGKRMLQVAATIEAKGHGEGLTAILIHKITHKAAGGTAIHSTNMEPQIRARLTPICEATKQERVRIMNTTGKSLSVNPRTQNFEQFLGQCRTQATAISDTKRKQAALTQVDRAESEEKAATAKAQTDVVPAAQAAIAEQLKIAFHNSLDQAVAAVQAALSVSHVDGPPAGRSGAGGQIRAQAPQTWATILNSAS